MDCRRVRKHLADKALGGASPAKVDAHVGRCRACSAELERLKSALSLLDRELEAALAVDVSPELITRARRSLSAATRPSGRRALRWQVAAAAAGVVSLISIALLMRPVSPPQPPQAESARLAPEPPEPAVPVSPKPTPSAPTGVTEPAPAESPAPLVARKREPAVLVPPGQEAAILSFHRKMQRGQIVMASVHRSRVPATEDRAPLPPLTIAALDVQPLRLTPIEIPSLAEIEPLDRKQRR